jgi:hypothetical protein
VDEVGDEQGSKDGKGVDVYGSMTAQLSLSEH